MWQIFGKRKETGGLTKPLEFAKSLGMLEGKLKGINDHIFQLDKEVQERDDRRHEEIDKTENRVMTALRKVETDLKSHVENIEKRQARNFRVLFFALIINTGVIGFIPPEQRLEFTKMLLAFIA